MNRLDKMVRSNREGIIRVARSLLDKHSGGVGNGAPDEPGPCECPDCGRAYKWLRLADSSGTDDNG